MTCMVLEATRSCNGRVCKLVVWDMTGPGLEKAVTAPLQHRWAAGLTGQVAVAGDGAQTPRRQH